MLANDTAIYLERQKGKPRLGISNANSRLLARRILTPYSMVAQMHQKFILCPSSVYIPDYANVKLNPTIVACRKMEELYVPRGFADCETATRFSLRRSIRRRRYPGVTIWIK